MFKYLCDLTTWPWARHLLKLPFPIRLSICILSFPICLTIYWETFPAGMSGTILAVPLALAAWTFAKPGACISFFGLILFQLIYRSIVFHSLFWPIKDIIAFSIGVLVFFTEAALIVSLRYILDRAEVARERAEQAERNITLAYEHQCRLDQIKSQFIINVNHELRTPLAAAYGYFEFLQMLLEQNGYLDHATHATYIKDALCYCEDLRVMVNNVLDTMELGSASKPFQCELLSIIAEVCAVIEHNELLSNNVHRIHLSIPEPLSVWADARSLRHILYNLLSNAFKFSPEASIVTVSATLFHDDPRQVCISVQDSGPGIPQDELPLLFHQFVRLKRDLGGTVRGAGLGLYISKRLVEAMQGQIWVESTGITGLGSCFYVTLPRIVQTPHDALGRTSEGYSHNAAHH